MNLKEFIRESVTSIVEAASELQQELAAKGAVINPPTDGGASETFEEGGVRHTFRRVQVVEFDVALTASTETSGGGKAGLKIWAAEAGVDGAHARTSEEVSRIRFSIPLALPASEAELSNRTARSQKSKKTAQELGGF